VSGSDPNRERGRVPGVTGRGRRENGETEKGKGGFQGVGQDGGSGGKERIAS